MTLSKATECYNKAIDIWKKKGLTDDASLFNIFYNVAVHDAEFKLKMYKTGFIISNQELKLKAENEHLRKAIEEALEWLNKPPSTHPFHINKSIKILKKALEGGTK